MNKRNELRAKLQAGHLRQQQQTRDGGGGGAGGQSSVSQIPKAKRPAAVAAISATVPKKQQRTEQHKFHHHKAHQQHHQPKFGVHHQQQQQQQPTGASAVLAGTTVSSSSSGALLTMNNNNSLEQRQQQQQQSLLLVREAAECAASAVDDAAGDVVVEEWGGGGSGGTTRVGMAPFVLSTAVDNSTGQQQHQQQRDGTEQEQPQQQHYQPVTAAFGTASAVPSSVVNAWLYSTDGRQIDEGIADLSLDKAVHLLSTVSVDHSPEAIARLINVVSKCTDLITDDQFRAMFPALRAQRLRGIDGAEKLLLLLINARKQRNNNVNQSVSKQQLSSSFTRPPPTKTAMAADHGAKIEQQTVAGGAKISADNDDDAGIILVTGEEAVNQTKQQQPAHCLSADEDYCQRLANKSADELLGLLLSTGTMDEQQQHFLVTELLAKRPDLFDVHSPNFGDQLNALFSSRLPIARALVILQLAHCASAPLIKRSVSLLLKNFNSSFNPALVVNFVAKVCAEDTKICLMLNGEQCFVLALYVLEDVEQQCAADMTEVSKLKSLDGVRLFCAVLATVLRRQSELCCSAVPLAKSPPLGGGCQFSGVASSSSSQPFYDLLEAFTRHYRAHMDQLRHANAPTSFFCPASGGGGLMRHRHALNLLYQTVCQNFPVVPSKCLFHGMFAPCDGTYHNQTKQHITRTTFDQLITGAIGEIFDLIIKMDKKGGAEVDLALNKAHQLVQHFRNCRDVQLSRYMPLLGTKVQQLVNSLAGRELKNSPHCALLLCSLDMIIVALRSFGTTATDDDDNGGEDGIADDGRPCASQQLSLIQTATIALRAVLQLLQQNRRARQIQSVCEKVCNAVVQLLKCNSSTTTFFRLSCSDAIPAVVGAMSGGCAADETAVPKWRQQCDLNTRRLINTHGVLLGELSDWKALHVPDRAILKRTVMTMTADGTN